MGFWSRVKELDKTFAWSFVGVLLTVVVFVYTEARVEKAEVTFDTLSETNVLDVHRDVASLQVLFRGEDIQDHNQNLRSLSIRISNTGDLPIRQGDYDQTLPWGIRIRDGKLISASMSEASSPYLKEQFAQVTSTESEVRLPKTILDRGEHVQADLLVLHPRDAVPTIEPFGKIAGIKDFKTLRSSETTAEPGLFRRSLAGSATVQGVRIISYPLALVIALATLIAAMSEVSDLINKRQTRKREQQLSHIPWLKQKAQTCLQTHT